MNNYLLHNHGHIFQLLLQGVTGLVDYQKKCSLCWTVKNEWLCKKSKLTLCSTFQHREFIWIGSSISILKAISWSSTIFCALLGGASSLRLPFFTVLYWRGEKRSEGSDTCAGASVGPFWAGGATGAGSSAGAGAGLVPFPLWAGAGCVDSFPLWAGFPPWAGARETGSGSVPFLLVLYRGEKRSEKSSHTWAGSVVAGFFMVFLVSLSLVCCSCCTPVLFGTGVEGSTCFCLGTSVPSFFFFSERGEESVRVKSYLLGFFSSCPLWSLCWCFWTFVCPFSFGSSCSIYLRAVSKWVTEASNTIDVSSSTLTPGSSKKSF